MPPRIIESPQALKNLIGQELGVTDWFTVSQERIAQFAEATEDRQWIHLDRERAARESPFGTTIAHGFLTLSLASHLMKQAFRNPLRHSSRNQLRPESRTLPSPGPSRRKNPRKSERSNR